MKTIECALVFAHSSCPLVCIYTLLSPIHRTEWCRDTINMPKKKQIKYNESERGRKNISENIARWMWWLFNMSGEQRKRLIWQTCAKYENRITNQSLGHWPFLFIISKSSASCRLCSNRSKLKIECKPDKQQSNLWWNTQKMNIIAVVIIIIGL